MKEEMRKDIAIAGLALAILLLMPTIIMPLIAAAAVGPGGLALVAFWAAYAFWAGSCIYAGVTHDVNGAFVACALGMIPVL